MQLNFEQQNAVTKPINLNLRIIAGPGTGKTTVLTSRFLYLITQKMALAHRILVLTFTRKATDNFLKRVQSQLPPTNKRFNIFTYHAFCFEILIREQKHLLHFKKNTRLQVIDETDQKNIIKTFLTALKPQFDLQIDAESIVEIIHWIKILQINFVEQKTQYLKILNELKDQLPTQNREQELLWTVFQKYLHYKTWNDLVDFNDLLVLTYQLLKSNPLILKKWQQRFQHVMIDEFQDTSTLQYNLITLLTDFGKQISITIVGDPDQTIYSWRNAHIKFILEFDRHFANVQTIYLKSNYRSNPAILRAANFLISRNKNRLSNQLIAKAQWPSKPIEIHSLPNRSEQVKQIIKTILTLKKAGNKLNQIAILYRANWLSGFIETELINHQLQYYVFKGMKFFMRREIKELLILLSAAISKDDFNISTILLWIPKLGTKTLYKFQKAAIDNQQTLWNFVLENYQNNKMFNQYKQKIFELQKYFSTWSLQFDNSQTTLPIICQTIISDYFIPRQQLFPDWEMKAKNIEVLCEMIKNYAQKNVDLSTREQLTQFLVDTKIYLADGLDPAHNSIQLMTVHNTKGLEFDHVFLFEASEDIFPSERSSNLEEERRLFFVALTRARKSVTITTNYMFTSMFVEELELLDQNLVKT